MTAETDRLIEELAHNARVASKPLEQRLFDTSAWFFGNKDRIDPMNFGKKAAFLEKTCWCLIELCALQTERIHELEGRSTHLWLPRGMNSKGSIHEYE